PRQSPSAPLLPPLLGALLPLPPPPSRPLLPQHPPPLLRPAPLALPEPADPRRRALPAGPARPLPVERQARRRPEPDVRGAAGERGGGAERGGGGGDPGAASAYDPRAARRAAQAAGQDPGPLSPVEARPPDP